MGLFHPEMLYESEEKGYLRLADTELNGERAFQPCFNKIKHEERAFLVRTT